MLKNIFVFSSTIISLIFSAQAQKSNKVIASDTGKIEVTIRDLVPKFILFYDKAVKINNSSEKRWKLWKEFYDFAAVPPTPQGDNLFKRRP